MSSDDEGDDGGVPAAGFEIDPSVAEELQAEGADMFAPRPVYEPQRCVPLGLPRDMGHGCYNCRSPDHQMGDCPLPRDPETIAQVRGRGGAGGGGGRYHAGAGDGPRAAPHRTGRPSAALCYALGIEPGAPPPYLERLRRFGFAPGYLPALATGLRLLERPEDYARAAEEAAAREALAEAVAERGAVPLCTCEAPEVEFPGLNCEGPTEEWPSPLSCVVHLTAAGGASGGASGGVEGGDGGAPAAKRLRA